MYILTRPDLVKNYEKGMIKNFNSWKYTCMFYMLRKIKTKFCYLALIVVKWGHCQDMDHFSCFYPQLHTKTLQ